VFQLYQLRFNQLVNDGEEFSSYYSGDNNPFSWITVLPARSRKKTRKRFVSDHAGILECSEMMAIYPECVELSRLDDSIWYARSSRQASAEFGEAALEAAADDIEAAIFKTKE